MSADDPIIRFQRVSKRYHLGQERSNARAALPGRWGEPNDDHSFLALDDVSFDVAKGEALGIVGSNGAGKSTALKVLAGVVAPTSGAVIRPKRLVSIIELGLGFNPDFTGIENLRYGGALLGLTADEVNAKAHEIIEFAELEDFANMPIKRYSTGMLARLGFSLATAVPTDVLVVDEVLSVGDWGFQRRSLGRMRELHDQGVTIVFVSHNLWVVNQLCDRAVLLDHGRCQATGPTGDVLGLYLGDTPFLLNAVDPTPGGDGEIQATAGATAERPAVPLSTGPHLQVAHGKPRIEMIDLHFDPPEIDPAGATRLVGSIAVHAAVPGARLILAAYWQGFAAFATPDVLPSEFLTEPGVYDFELAYDQMHLCPCIVTFQIAAVTGDDPDDPEQLLPNAFARIEAKLVVRGEVTSRPGMYLPRTWTLEPRVVEQEVVEEEATA